MTIMLESYCSGIIKLDHVLSYTNLKRITSMTTKRREYIRELKFEAILVIDHKLKIIEVAEPLEIGISSLDN